MRQDVLWQTDSAGLMHWGTSAVAAVLAHAALVVALLPRVDTAEPDAGAPVVMVDFAPQAMAPPAAPSELAPGPQLPEPPAEAQAEREQVTEQKLADAEPAPQTRAVPEPEVALPRPVEEAKPEVREEQAAQPAVPETVATAPPSVEIPAERPAGPAVGRTLTVSALAVSTWQSLLSAHMEKFKRYPRQARSAEGIASVGFTMDRTGRVLSTRIVRSSGSEVLDQDAMALVRRAEPLPTPPAGIGEENLTLVAPIRYVAGQKR